MEDEPKVVFESDADAFSEAAELQDFFAGGGAEGRRCGAKEKRASDTDPLQGLAENTFFEGLDIDDDVGEFRHEFSELDAPIWDSEHRTTTGHAYGEDGPNGMVVR